MILFPAQKKPKSNKEKNCWNCEKYAVIGGNVLE